MNKWTREETIVAFNVYCKIPFKSSSKTHPLIIKYANLLNRTPSALNMKIGNIGRLDPDLYKKGISGLVHGAKMEEEIWKEFRENPEQLAYESEKIISKLQGKSIEKIIDTNDLPQGKEREIIIKQRINQSFFRMTVLSSYNNRCCISGIGNIGWSENTANRTNPQNGLCMNSFFHKAYDKHLLGITPDMRIVVSEELLQGSTEISFFNYLKTIDGKKILLPDKFLPQKELLEIHYNKFINR